MMNPFKILLGRWKYAFLILVMGWLLVWAAWSNLYRPDTFSPLGDIWDYAQQGRQLVRGEGFSSQFTYPILMKQDAGHVPYSNLWRPPGYPWLASMAFRISGNFNLSSLILLGCLFYILTAGLMVRIVEEWIDTSYGWLAGLAWLLAPAVQGSAFSGLSEPVYSFLVALLGYQVIIGTRQGWAPIRTGVLGVLTGIAWLTRTETIFLIPVLLVYLFINLSKEIRWKLLGLYLLTLVLTMSPWWIRNMMVTGHPLFNMSYDLWGMFTPTWPGWYRFRMVTDSGFPIGHWEEVLFKWGKQLLLNLKFIMSIHAFLVPLAVIGFFVTRLEWKKTHPGVWILPALGLSWLGLSLTEPGLRFFLGLAPLVMALGTVYLIRLVQWAGKATIIKTMSWVMMVIVGFSVPILEVTLGDKPQNQSQIMKPMWLTEGQLPQIARTGVLITDTPDFVAWYGDHRTVWLPRKDDLPTLLKMEPHITGILLTPNVRKIQPDPDIEYWKKLLFTKTVPVGFGNPVELAGGALYFPKEGADNLIKPATK